MNGCYQVTEDTELGNCFREADRRGRLVEITGNSDTIDIAGMRFPGEWRVLLVDGANQHRDATAPTVLEAFQRALRRDAEA